MIAGSPTLEAINAGLSAWLLTYLVHSSVLLGFACLLWRWLPATSLPAKEFLLKVGLIGGLLTASLQIGLGLQPLTRTWELPSPSRSDTRDVSTLVASSAAPKVEKLQATDMTRPEVSEGSTSTRSRSAP